MSPLWSSGSAGTLHLACLASAGSTLALPRLSWPGIGAYRHSLCGYSDGEHHLSPRGGSPGGRDEYPRYGTAIGRRQRYRESLAASLGATLSGCHELYLPPFASPRVSVGRVVDVCCEEGKPSDAARETGHCLWRCLGMDRLQSCVQTSPCLGRGETDVTGRPPAGVSVAIGDRRVHSMPRQGTRGR